MTSGSKEKALEILRRMDEEGMDLKDLIQVIEAIDFHKKDQNNTLHKRISDILHELGMPSNLLGYKYLRTAIEMVYETPLTVGGITRILYPNVSKMYDTTNAHVEQAIDRAIKSAWNRGDTATFDKYFGSTIKSKKGKPTNGEFIAMIADRLRIEDGL